jgi:hypothetical protein
VNSDIGERVIVESPQLGISLFAPPPLREGSPGRDEKVYDRHGMCSCVHAFAAPHKIWRCDAKETPVSLQSSHAGLILDTRDARRRCGE